MKKIIKKTSAFIIALSLTFPMTVLNPVSAETEAPSASPAPSAVDTGGTLDLYAETAVLYDVQTQTVLYDKDAYKRMYPASMTKMMTAIIFLQYYQTNEFITCGDELNYLPVGSSRAWVEEGEVLTVENALRALLIPSGNDIALTIARVTAKRGMHDDSVSYPDAEKWFAGKMNDEAKSLGCKDTNFVNPHGYQDTQHYTTAYDMALICAEAMKNPDIASIVAETSFHGNGASNGISDPDPSWLTVTHTWLSLNKLLDSSSEYYYKYATGIKTGSDDEAGECLAASATKDGRDIIAVIMKTTPDTDERWQDAITLLNYGFDNFAYENIQEDNQALGEIQVIGADAADAQTVQFAASGNIQKLLETGQLERVTKEFTFNQDLIAYPAATDGAATDNVATDGAATDNAATENASATQDDAFGLSAPISEGQLIGTVTYSLDGTVLGTSSIFAVNSVAAAPAATPEPAAAAKSAGFISAFTDWATSVFAIPVYVGVVILAAVIIRAVVVKKRRQRSAYTLRKRY